MQSIVFWHCPACELSQPLLLKVMLDIWSLSSIVSEHCFVLHLAHRPAFLTKLSPHGAVGFIRKNVDSSPST